MKRFRILYILLFFIALVACTKEKQEEPEKIEGIHCRVEGDTVIFYGSGVLTNEEASKLMKEVNNEEVRNLIIEKGITEIEEQFFGWGRAPWLETLKLEGTKIIGSTAFFYCTNLREVIFTEGVKYIESGAFSRCEKLESVEFPKSIEIISPEAFKGTPWLETQKDESGMVIINDILLDTLENTELENVYKELLYVGKTLFSEEWLETKRKDNGLVIINDILIDGSKAEGNIIIPNGVKHIAENAFGECETITEVQLPMGLETIGEFSFFGCSNLARINIPETVKYIGSSAFSNCTEIVEIIIPDAVECIGADAFSGCANLVTVKLPNGIEHIGSRMFRECINLKNIEFPKGLKSIGIYAFSQCEKLAQVELHDGLKWIGQSAFDQCESLEHIVFPKSLETLGDYSFARCTNLKEIVFPKNLTDFGSCAFDRTLWLESQLEDQELVIVNGFLMRAMTEESGKHLELPKNVEVIAQYAFSESQFASIVIPESVKEIKGEAFADCGMLKTVEIFTNLTELPKELFYRCDNLENVILPEGLKVISKDDFSDCLLSRIYIPNSVTTIEEDAFEKCENVVVIYCNANSYAKQYAEEHNISYVELSESILEIDIEKLQERNETNN